MLKHDQDLLEIEILTRKLYACICFEEDEIAPVEELKGLFIEHGKLINNNQPAPRVYGVQQFIDSFRTLIDTRKLKSLFEHEIANQTHLSGNVAHRLSTYDARICYGTEEPHSTGVNSIQMIKVAGRWKVVSVIWSDQRLTAL